MAHGAFHQTFNSIHKWHSFQLGLCAGVLALVLLYKTRPRYAAVFFFWAITVGLAAPTDPKGTISRKPWYFLSAICVTVVGGITVISVLREIRALLYQRLEGSGGATATVERSGEELRSDD